MIVFQGFLLLVLSKDEFSGDAKIDLIVLNLNSWWGREIETERQTDYTISICAG